MLPATEPHGNGADPARAPRRFAEPEDVLHADGMTYEEKRRLLERWRDRCAEDGPSTENIELQAVTAALAILIGADKPQSAG